MKKAIAPALALLFLCLTIYCVWAAIFSTNLMNPLEFLSLASGAIVCIMLTFQLFYCTFQKPHQAQDISSY